MRFECFIARSIGINLNFLSFFDPEMIRGVQTFSHARRSCLSYRVNILPANYLSLLIALLITWCKGPVRDWRSRMTSLMTVPRRIHNCVALLPREITYHVIDESCKLVGSVVFIVVPYFFNGCTSYYFWFFKFTLAIIWWKVSENVIMTLPSEPIDNAFEVFHKISSSLTGVLYAFATRVTFPADI